MKCKGGIVPPRARSATCSGRDVSIVGARQEIVAVDRNGGTGTRLLGRRRNRPHHPPVTGYFPALTSGRPVRQRQAELHVGLNLKKIFSPEQNSGARNI